MTAQDDFRKGYEEAFKAIRGNVQPPAAPAMNATPAGSTAFREGIKAGLRAAGVDLQ